MLRGGCSPRLPPPPVWGGLDGCFARGIEAIENVSFGYRKSSLRASFGARKKHRVGASFPGGVSYPSRLLRHGVIPLPPGRELILGGIASSRSLHCHWPQRSRSGLVPAWVGLEAMGPSSSGLWGGPDLPQRGAKRLLLLLSQGLAHHPAADRRPQRLRKVLLEVLRGRPSLVGKHRAPGLCGHPHSVRRVGHPRGGDGVQEPRECPPSRGRDERVSRGGGS